MAFTGTFKITLPVVVQASQELIELAGGPPDVRVEKDIEGTYAWVTSIRGDKHEVQALLTVYRDDTKALVLDTLGVSFEPVGDARWDRQAYLAFAQHPRMAGMVSDEVA